MGQVVPFISRLRDSGDWTAAERARLDELADRLAAAGIRVEVIYGATDNGDPWCAVKDENEEVLIHVARIDGIFVVHSALDDVLSEGADLHAVLRERLDAAPELFAAPATAEILPFQTRHAQSVLALLAVAAFFYETLAPVPAEAAEAPPAPDTVLETPPPAADDAPGQERQLTVQGAAVAEPVHEGPAPLAPSDGAAAREPAPVAERQALPAAPEATRVATAQASPGPTAPAAAEPAVVRIEGTDGDDLLVGGSEAEHLLGGAGNDTLQGGGGHDTLDGGAGDDRIEIAEGATAIGGQGADVFVLNPIVLGRADTFLGHIVDFNLADGDQVLAFSGRQIEVPARPAPPTTPESEPAVVTTPSDGFGSAGFGPSDFGPTLVPPTRVEIDIDGDGVGDGYLLVGPGRAPPEPVDEAVVSVGRTWFDAGL